MSNTQLTENLNTILDNFQMVVGSGMTTSVYQIKIDPQEGEEYPIYFPLFNLLSHKGVGIWVWNSNGFLVERSVRDIDIQSDFDGLYPIDPWMEPEKYSYKVSKKKDRRSKEILMENPVSDKDKELLKEWFLSGGDVKNYRYGDRYIFKDRMGNMNWWRFTKGLLWKLYNYLLVNLNDENLETIDEELSMVLMDVICERTSMYGRITEDLEENTPYTTLQERYEDPETQKVEREIVKLKFELERKEKELFYLKYTRLPKVV